MAYKYVYEGDMKSPFLLPVLLHLQYKWQNDILLPQGAELITVTELDGLSD